MKAAAKSKIAKVTDSKEDRCLEPKPRPASRAKPNQDLQDLVAGLLRGMGYHVAWIAPLGPDKGIDIVAGTDPLGVTGPRIKVQVKRHQERMAVDAVRSFIAVLGDNDIGVYVAAGGFTKNAEDEARRQEKRRIMLLDLKPLRAVGQALRDDPGGATSAAAAAADLLIYFIAPTLG